MTVDLELPPITSLNAKGDGAAKLDDPQVGDRFCVDYMRITIERREDNGCLVRIEKPFGPRLAFILASSFNRWHGRGTNQMAAARDAVGRAGMNSFQQRVFKWAVDTFGPVARNRDERAARLVEEAIEVAQCEGLAEDVIARILRRVYSREPGKLAQEIGGCATTLAALAENAGLDVSVEGNKELARVLRFGKAHFARKHAEKAAAGVANLSDTFVPRRVSAADKRRVATEFERLVPAASNAVFYDGTENA